MFHFKLLNNATYFGSTFIRVLYKSDFLMEANGGLTAQRFTMLKDRKQPVTESHVFCYHRSKIEICSQSAPLFSAKQDERKRRGREGEKEMRKMEKKVVNVTEPWKSWPGVGMIRYTRFFSAVAAGINTTYISPSLVQEISSPGTYNLNA